MGTGLCRRHCPPQPALGRGLVSGQTHSDPRSPSAVSPAGYGSPPTPGTAPTNSSGSQQAGQTQHRGGERQFFPSPFPPRSRNPGEREQAQDRAGGVLDVFY